MSTCSCEAQLQPHDWLLGVCPSTPVCTCHELPERELCPLCERFMRGLLARIIETADMVFPGYSQEEVDSPIGRGFGLTDADVGPRTVPLRYLPAARDFLKAHYESEQDDPDVPWTPGGDCE